MTTAPSPPTPGLHPVSGSPAEVTSLLRAWLSAADPDPLLIRTSGSTGEPKLVRLSQRAVLASVSATHRRLGGPRPWTLLLPATYVAGVMVIARSLAAGSPPDLELCGNGYLSLVPTQLRRLLPEHAEVLASYDAVLLGGAAIDPALRADAEARGIRVVASYGMSETCGGCVYDGIPLDGVEVSLGPADEVRLRGQMLFDGYDAAPADLDDGWFTTSDRGELLDGRLRVLGRVDDMINSGGLKVPAAAVRDRLAEHPGVVAVEVLGVSDPEWGARVVAFVVGEVSLEEARQWVAECCPRTWAPRQLVPVATLPLLGNGKVDREALRRLAQ